MARIVVIGGALALLLGGWFVPGAYGNDTGGIIPYTPDLKPAQYRALAAEYCARWNRLSQLTSIDREYGGFVGFVCIDRPHVIH
jgi:hypothetical protein